MSYGKSIRLFLIDGSPNGLLTAEIMNWTGHVIMGPRSRLAELIKRLECRRTGVYFLVGSNTDNPYRPLVYIGETDDVSQRLRQHNRPEEQGGKDFWEKVCFITSKDENLTKAHVKYLESQLIDLASQTGNSQLKNNTAHQYNALPEADLSDMAFFVEQIKTVLPVLGFNFLKQTTTHQIIKEKQSESFEAFEMFINLHNIRAQAKEIDEDFVVLKGSQTKSTWSKKSSGSYQKLFESLLETRVLESSSDDKNIFTQDYVFSGPSAAAAIVSGQEANGRKRWIHRISGLNYGDWQTQEIDKQEELKNN